MKLFSSVSQTRCFFFRVIIFKQERKKKYEVNEQEDLTAIP